MSVKGGVLYVDFTTVDLSGNDPVTIPGIFDAIKRTWGKPVYVYADFSGATVSGFATISAGSGVFNLTLSAVSQGSLIAVEYVVDDDDAVTPAVVVLTPAGE